MCDTVAVVRPGEVLFAKNSDRDPNEAQLLEWHPARAHARGEVLQCTALKVPQAERTHAIVISRPYWMWGAEMGANEHGVVIGNEAVFTRTPVAKHGLLGMDLLRLALERASTAEEAVQVIRDLLAAHGQGGRCAYEDAGFRYHNSFLIADARGAYVMETAGAAVAVEQVSAGARAISNGLTIPGFADQHADRLRGTVSRCKVRRARSESLARDAQSPEQLASVLRDHGAGLELPSYSPLNGAMAAPCMHAGGLVASSQTTASFIARLRPGAIDLYATATSAPCLSGFKPLDVHTPVSLGAPTGIADEESAWWRFERLHRAVVGNRAATLALRTARDQWERATWERRWSSPEAFSQWDRFVSAQLELVGQSAEDERPAYVRRYWRIRDAAARSAKPELPAFAAPSARLTDGRRIAAGE